VISLDFLSQNERRNWQQISLLKTWITYVGTETSLKKLRSLFWSKFFWRFPCFFGRSCV